MPVIVSALKQTSPERVTVVLDDETEIKATLGVIADLRLYVGRTLEDAELEQLRVSAARALCISRAVELLGYRPMSAKELLDKLIQKGENPDAARAAVQWMCDNGLIDDVRYAGMVVRHYAGKGYGTGRIRQELGRRGVPRDLWEEALAELPEGNEKLDRFLSSRLKAPGDRSQVQKISAALYRRGFSWEEIRAALSRFQAELEEE